MNGSFLGIGAGIVVIAALASWFRLLRQVKVPRDRRPWYAVMATGALLGVFALFREPGWIGGTFAVVAVAGGSVYLGLRLGTAQRKVVPAVAVGGPIIEFTAPDEEGKEFSLSSLRGKPFLLKFFRGHW